MKNNNSEWENISFMMGGKHRRRILELVEKPMTPTQIKKETQLHFNIVSRTLIELETKGFVECLNPNQKLTRFYRITTKGKNILKKLKEME